MNFRKALKKVKEGKIVTFHGGYLEPYDDYFFIRCIWNPQDKFTTKIYESYSFYKRKDFKEYKK